MHWLSGANLSAVGGFSQRQKCADKIYQLKSRVGPWWGQSAQSINAISINLLELLGRAITAYVMVVLETDHSKIVGAPVVMFVSIVTMADKKCGGRRDPRAAFLMRYLGRIEMRAGWCFELAYIPRGQKCVG